MGNKKKSIMTTYEASLTDLLNAEEKEEKLLDEAQKETKKNIDNLKADLQREFESKKKDTGKEEKELKEKIAKAVEVNKNDFANNKDSVIDMIVQRTTSFRLEVHRNVRGDFSELKAK